MTPDRFESWLARRIADDRGLARLLARLGPREALDAGGVFHGDGHVAPLEVVVEQPMRLLARLEITGAPAYVQGVRFVLGPPGPGTPADAWLPILDVPPEQADRWIASRSFGGWRPANGRRLGYQGWWLHSPGVGKADLSTRIHAHARHANGHLLWIGSRTNAVTRGETHKQVVAVLLAEADD